MTRKHLNPLAANLGIELAAIRRSRSKKAEQGFWLAAMTCFDAIKRANTRADRDRFTGAIEATAQRILAAETV
jgi:hypothetical protein